MTLPNFGDERAVANVLRWADLGVPVLVHAFAGRHPEDMTIADRRDSFCGKMSVCHNLQQYGIPYTLTSLHTVDPTSPGFRADLRRFVATCRVAGGLRNVRLGEIGARPAAFNTVRYSEKLLERSGMSVETLDLSELFGRALRLKDGDPRLAGKVEEIRSYAPVGSTPSDALVRWLVWASSSKTGWPRTSSRPRPFSAGRPWRSSTVSCRACS